jgi:hypothetical protein
LSALRVLLWCAGLVFENPRRVGIDQRKLMRLDLELGHQASFMRYLLVLRLNPLLADLAEDLVLFSLGVDRAVSNKLLERLLI